MHDYLGAHHEEQVRYDRAMGSTTDGFDDLANAIDLAAASTVVSVGGGSGAELVPLLKRWPHLDAVLTDLPDALAGAAAVLAEYGIADRVTVVAGDARVRVPAADAYVLSTVLRCFDDAGVIAVLSACRRAALPGAVLHVCEMPLPAGPPAHPAATTDLTAWVAYGGADRTIDGWTRLHAVAGWTGLTVTPCCEGPFAVLTTRL